MDRGIVFLFGLSLFLFFFSFFLFLSAACCMFAFSSLLAPPKTSTFVFLLLVLVLVLTRMSARDSPCSTSLSPYVPRHMHTPLLIPFSSIVRGHLLSSPTFLFLHLCAPPHARTHTHNLQTPPLTAPAGRNQRGSCASLRPAGHKCVKRCGSDRPSQ